MKKLTNNNYILTGATSVLGSHILYQLMQAICNNGYQGKIIALVRSKKDRHYTLRLNDLLREGELRGYLAGIDVERMLRENIVVVDFDLRYADESAILKQIGDEKYHLIHTVSSVNLGNNAYAFEEIKHNNYLGTLSLITALEGNLVKMSYVSKSYSFPSGRPGMNRDWFEECKVQTERDYIMMCGLYNVACEIARPRATFDWLIDDPYMAMQHFIDAYIFGTPVSPNQTIRIPLGQPDVSLWRA